MAWEMAEALRYYQKQGAPQDQNALTGLLREIQHECGGIPTWAVARIGEEYGVKEKVNITSDEPIVFQFDF